MPLRVIVPGALLAGRPAVTSATCVTSAVPIGVPFGEAVTTARTVSPATMFGVTTSQQPAPGWLTSAMPVSSTTTGSLAIVAPPRAAACVTSKTMVSPGVRPFADRKSRAGKVSSACVGAGGSLTVVVGSGVAANAGPAVIGSSGTISAPAPTAASHLRALRSFLEVEVTAIPLSGVSARDRPGAGSRWIFRAHQTRVALGKPCALPKVGTRDDPLTYAHARGRLEAAGGGGVGVRVLVVDDEPAIRQLLSRALTGHGFEVDAAPDGDAGLEMLGRA